MRSDWVQGMEEKHVPYLCLDHLKMGLIRTGLVAVTPTDKLERITAAVWPVAREMIKTCMENGQRLIVEGCYVPPDWRADFPQEQQERMRCICLVLSKDYICKNMKNIVQHACDAEQRMDDDVQADALVRENAYFAAHFDEIYTITDDYERELDALRRIL